MLAKSRRARWSRRNSFLFSRHWENDSEPFRRANCGGFLGKRVPCIVRQLVQRYVGKHLEKKRPGRIGHRPLTPRQLDYAAQDVRDLPLIFDKLSKDLLAKGRLEWLKEEILAKQSDLAAFERQENCFAWPACSR